MTKEQKIKELAAAIENAYIKDNYGYGITTSETIAEGLVEEGWGNIRDFKKQLIQAYLTEGAAGVMKIMMEEV